jgi:hypothetical protein
MEEPTLCISVFFNNTLHIQYVNVLLVKSENFDARYGF